MKHRFILTHYIVLHPRRYNHSGKNCSFKYFQFSGSNAKYEFSPSRFHIPMPQLTPDSNRVSIMGLQTSDTSNYDSVNHIKIGHLVQEIRICEDYCLSDIYVIDLAKYSVGHIPKISLPLLRKLQLCSLVSTENSRLHPLSCLCTHMQATSN